MRRPIVSRLLSSLFALWFVAVIVDPGIRTCPDHASHGAHASGHSAHQMAGAEHGAPMPMSGGCTCVGSCATAPALPTLPVVATFAVSAEIIAPHALPELVDRAPAAPSDLRLPFANGPPQA